MKIFLIFLTVLTLASYNNSEEDGDVKVRQKQDTVEIAQKVNNKFLM